MAFGQHNLFGSAAGVAQPPPVLDAMPQPPKAMAERSLPASPFATVSPVSPTPQATPMRLTAEDRTLMNAVAAQHLRYGQVEEALAILQLVNRLWPEDAQTLRLLTQCFIALADWPAAEAASSAHERLAGEMSLESGDLLRRALIMFRRYGLDPALGAFRRFIGKVAQGSRP